MTSSTTRLLFRAQPSAKTRLSSSTLQALNACACACKSATHQSCRRFSTSRRQKAAPRSSENAAVMSTTARDGNLPSRMQTAARGAFVSLVIPAGITRERVDVSARFSLSTVSTGGESFAHCKCSKTQMVSPKCVRACVNVQACADRALRRVLERVARK